VEASAALTLYVRNSDPAVCSASASVEKLPTAGRREATAEDYQLVSVPVMVGGTVFSVLVAAVDLEPGAQPGARCAV